MELNRDQIIKALECCVKSDCHGDCIKLKCPALVGEECIYCDFNDDFKFSRKQLIDVLSTMKSQEQRIEELETENMVTSGEIERLTVENEELTDNNKWSAKRILEADKRVAKLTEEIERFFKLDVEVCGAELSRYTENIVQMAKQDRANTVRKMQERFIAEIEQTPNANEHFIKAWKSRIDQIAKEMLEGKNER